MAGRTRAPRAHPEERRRRPLQRQPAPEHDQRVHRLVRLLLLPAQAGREGRVHDAHRGGRPAGQGDGGRQPHRAAHRQRAAPDAAVALLPALAQGAQGSAAAGVAEGLHRHRDPPLRDHLGPVRLRDPRRADRGRAGVADRWRRGDLRLGGAPAHRGPPHPLGGLVPHPPAGALQGPQDALHHALRPHRGAQAPRRPRAAAARTAGRDRRLPGLHPAALPARLRGHEGRQGPQHPAGPHHDGDRCGGAEDLRGLPAALRQCAAREGLLGDARPVHGPAGPEPRRRRHGRLGRRVQDHPRRGRLRHAEQAHQGRHPRPDPRRRLPPGRAQHALRDHPRIPRPRRVAAGVAAADAGVTPVTAVRLP
ncbi:putative Uncharacterized 50.6 kDa protein in the 5\\'region of gyrA and gyrB [Actinacidiphila cocklensis]|uniref:Uncharacterized 50.6 kDa protein in the 5\'region of gyrA and gyrB n=1 Tax=Actinacidiphila cocklensis TaxID=887465 RepID=A0A9W4EBE3_9ACTN|nr:putative Uncharacterized 50.6 kDa protein in the 5\\'region of gyrA and gyrB [Actinacidiphila cocklensis]